MAKTSPRFNDEYIPSVSLVMTSVIVLYEIYKNGYTYSAWIGVPKKFFGRLFFNKSYNADRVADFFSASYITLYFTDKSIYPVIYKIMNDLMKASHIKFLKRYEIACKYFRIRNPIFTLNYYNSLKYECWTNYQKIKAQHGFKK